MPTLYPCCPCETHVGPTLTCLLGSHVIFYSYFIARVLFFKCKNAFSVNSRLGRSSRAWSAIYFPKQPQVRFSGTEWELIKSRTRLFIFANYYFILVSFQLLLLVRLVLVFYLFGNYNFISVYENVFWPIVLVLVSVFVYENNLGRCVVHLFYSLWLHITIICF